MQNPTDPGRKALARWAVAAALAASLLLLTPAWAADQAGPSPERDLTPEARAAIRAGLDYLARTQNADGSWLSDGRTGRFPTAVTALASLSLLAGGSSYYSGPHAPQVREAVGYLLRQADPSTGLIGGRDEGGRPMFGHGFAMLFLAQVYGAEADAALRARLRAALERAVALTARSQGELGGWYYQPDSPEDEGAVTITQMQGLRACANAGIPVPEETARKGLDYIRRSVNADGGIAYQASREGDSRSAITCAAVAVMYAGGLYEGEMVEGALRYAVQNTPAVAPQPSGGGHFYYAHMYLSQVLYFRGGEPWDAYFRELSAWLVGVQQADGSWNGDQIGVAYGTAVALLILQLPYNYLPILQR